MCAFRRTYTVCLAAALSLMVSASAQERCSDQPLGFSLPLEVTSYLEQVSDSPFAQAYLLALVLNRAPDSHPLHPPAYAFAHASAAELFDTTRTAPPATAAVLEALRCDAQREERLRLLLYQIAGEDEMRDLLRPGVRDGAGDRLLGLRPFLRGQRALLTGAAEPRFDRLRDALDEGLAFTHHLDAARPAFEAAQEAFAARLTDLAQHAAASSTVLADSAHADPDVDPATRQALREAAQEAAQAFLDVRTAARLTTRQAAAERANTALRYALDLLPPPPDSTLDPYARGAVSSALVEDSTDVQEACRGYLADRGALLQQRPLAEDGGTPCRVSRVEEPTETRMRLDEESSARLVALQQAYERLWAEGGPPPRRPAAGDALTAVEAGFTTPAAALIGATLPSTTDLAPTAPPQAPAHVLWALTDFIVRRAQEEVVVAFIERIEDDFGLGAGTGGTPPRFDAPPQCPSTTPLPDPSLAYVLHAAFPATRQLLAAARGEVYTLSRAMWRAALANDLRNLPHALLADDRLIWATMRLAGQEAADYCAAYPRIAQIRPLYTAARSLNAGGDPLDVAIGLADTVPTALSLEDTSAAVIQQAAWLFAETARDFRLHRRVPTGSTVPLYIPSLQAYDRGLPGQPTLFGRLLLRRFALRQKDPVARDGAASVWTPAQIADLDRGLRRAVEAIEVTRQRLAALEGATQQGYAAYVSAAIGQGRTLLSLARSLAHGQSTAPAIVASLDTVDGYWRDVVAIEAALYDGGYTEALTAAMGLYTTVTRYPLPGTVRTLGALAAGLASATTGEEMQSAFRAAAAPVGGYRGKRRGSTGPFTINAYVGGTGGWERVGTASNDQLGDKGFATAAGAAVPLGLEWRFATDTKGWSYSAFAPVLDLGALVSYRFGNTLKGDGGTVSDDASVSKYPDVRLEQVVAPGLYLVLGTPAIVSFGAGVQLIPNLRTITPSPSGATAAQDAVLGDALRLGAFVGIDLPLFQF